MIETRGYLLRHHPSTTPQHTYHDTNGNTTTTDNTKIPTERVTTTTTTERTDTAHTIIPYLLELHRHLVRTLAQPEQESEGQRLFSVGVLHLADVVRNEATLRLALRKQALV